MWLGYLIIAVGVIVLFIGNQAYPGKETTVSGLIFLAVGVLYVAVGKGWIRNPFKKRPSGTDRYNP